MRWFCIHNWAPWSDVVANSNGLFQATYCIKCRKAKWRRV